MLNIYIIVTIILVFKVKSYDENIDKNRMHNSSDMCRNVAISSEYQRIAAVGKIRFGDECCAGI